jgi:hypothetical protein
MDEDLMKANRVQFQCLKSRDMKPFEKAIEVKVMSADIAALHKPV